MNIYSVDKHPFIEALTLKNTKFLSKKLKRLILKKELALKLYIK